MDERRRVFLDRTDLNGADLSGANLSGVLALIPDQLSGTLGNSSTKLSPEIPRPAGWSKAEDEQRRELGLPPEPKLKL
jgi:Pentapeptide repeats (8 copies)